MHELSIAMNIVEISTDYAIKNDSEKVLEMEIEVGELSGVVEEALDFAMGAAIKNTLCEGASWKIVKIKALAKCKSAGKTYELDNLYSACPFCNEYGHELVQGKELRLRSILVE